MYYLISYLFKIIILTNYDIELKSQYIFETIYPNNEEYDEPLLVYII